MAELMNFDIIVDDTKGVHLLDLFNTTSKDSFFMSFFEAIDRVVTLVVLAEEHFYSNALLMAALCEQ